MALNTEQVYMVKAWIAVVGLITVFASTPNEIGVLNMDPGIAQSSTESGNQEETRRSTWDH